VQAPGPERQVGPGFEDAGDVVADLVAGSALAGGVVLEHHVRRVERDDGVHVVPIPAGVVAIDRLAVRHRRPV
jgi:hypothetical protein